MEINVIESSKKYNYKVGLSDDKETKWFTSSNANYCFNLKTGTMYSWGNKLTDDPSRFPAPNILDCEITTICNKGCKFCFPAETKITMEDGSTKNIENIVVGDKVLSKDISSMNNTINEVKEIYEREIDDVLITFELEDGTTITTTENHPFYVKGKGWVEAKNITTDDEFDVI